MHTTSSGLEKKPATAAWRGLAARPPHVDGGGAGQGGDPEETIGEQALIRHVGQRAARGEARQGRSRGRAMNKAVRYRKPRRRFEQRLRIHQPPAASSQPSFPSRQLHANTLQLPHSAAAHR